MSGFAPKKFVVRIARAEDIDAVLDLYEAVASEGRYIAAELPIDHEDFALDGLSRWRIRTEPCS